MTAIIALHSSGLGRRLLLRRDEGPIARTLRVLLGMVLTGLAVEIALIPFALYHFHKAGLFGVAANLVAIPLTTFVIMPLEAGALILDIAGIGPPLWWAAGHALQGLLLLARTVASARGAVATLASMPSWSFALMVAGGLWLCLWTTRPRLFGFVPFAVGAVAAFLSPTRDLLVTGDGRHLAVVATDGRPMMLEAATSCAISSARLPASMKNLACWTRRRSGPAPAIPAAQRFSGTGGNTGCWRRARRRGSTGNRSSRHELRPTSPCRIAGCRAAARHAGSSSIGRG